MHRPHLHAPKEQCIEGNTKVHINSIDLEKAFDSIHSDTLWNILLAYGCPEKFLNIIKICIIHNKKLTEWFNVSCEVHQAASYARAASSPAIVSSH